MDKKINETWLTIDSYFKLLVGFSIILLNVNMIPSLEGYVLMVVVLVTIGIAILTAMGNISWMELGKKGENK